MGKVLSRAEIMARVWDINDVRRDPEEYHFGGGLGNNLNPNIIDTVLPYGEDQKTILGAYKMKKACELPALRKISIEE